jgi:hypothetical protein
MAYNFVKKKGTCIDWLYKGKWSPSNYQLFPALRQNLGGDKLNDYRNVGTVVTQMQIRQDTDFCHSGLEQLVPR